MDLKQAFILFLINVSMANAQQEVLSNSNFKKYDEKVITSLYYLDTSNSFAFNYNNNFLGLEPNRRAQVGLNFSYKFLDFSYGYSPLFLSENKDNKDSKLFSLNTRFYHKKWMQSFTFINQKGFYITDGQTQVEFPRLRTTKFGGSTSYIFNENFSFRTITNQNEWQIKSAGSFIPTLSIFYTNFDLNDNNPNTKSNIYIASLAPSYFYNLVINQQFLVSGGIAVGGGLNSIDKEIASIFEWSSSLKIGYNTDSFFTFINLNYIDFAQQSDANIRLDDQILTFKFTAGYRFDPPKKLKKYYDKTTQTIGL